MKDSTKEHSVSLTVIKGKIDNKINYFAHPRQGTVSVPELVPEVRLYPRSATQNLPGAVSDFDP